jgi:NAD(P)-dependent dehydrogenase (short-subunit alcohol dehydrogenase family)
VGKTAIVTGANTGIGKEIARGLVGAGMHVILACRDTAKGEAARAELGKDQTEVRALDVSDEKSIKAFASGVSGPIDVLVNNAGAWWQDRKTSAEGVELQWATNVVGPTHLTQLLLPRLKEAPAGRVINVASTAAGGLDLDDVQFEKRKYNGVKAYSACKQANRMVTWALAGKLAGTKVTANALSPGLVKTELNRSVTGFLGFVFKMLGPMQITPAKGADTAIWMATAPELDGVSNKFYVGRKEKPCKFREPQAAVDKLWSMVALPG